MVRVKFCVQVYSVVVAGKLFLDLLLLLAIFTFPVTTHLFEAVIGLSDRYSLTASILLCWLEMSC